MPWTAKQKTLLQAATHDRRLAKTLGMSQADAKRMAAEGVKKAPAKAHRASGKGRKG